MYHVETRADNSGYANYRVICLVVNGSSFDSEQVFQVSNGYRRVPAIIENEIPVKTTHILLSLRFLCRPTTLYIIARAVEHQSAIYTENS
jgi:hypothetical protein